jgi:hypothetical protein
VVLAWPWLVNAQRPPELLGGDGSGDGGSADRSSGRRSGMGHLAVRYALFGQVLADRPGSALDALREAASLAQGRWWALFGSLLAVAVCNLAGAAMLGLGLLISFPVGLLATASLFRGLQQQTAPGRARSQVTSLSAS